MSEPVPATDADPTSWKRANEQSRTGNGSSPTNHRPDDGKDDANPNHRPPSVTAPGAPEIRPVGGPVPVAWRENTLTRARELEALCDWNSHKYPRESDWALVTAIKCHLDAARQAARAQPLEPRKWFRLFRNGPLIERATSNLDAAEAQLLNLAPPDYVLGQMPSLLRHVQRHLLPTDPGRQEFERIARSVGINDSDHSSSQNRTDQDVNERETIENERGKIVATVRAASSECLREHLRLRNFRNVVAITAALMALLAVGVALTGYLSPTLVPLCFSPQEAREAVVVCPTNQSAPFIRLRAGETEKPPDAKDIDDVVRETANRGDLIVVELVGLTAAAIAAAAAIKNIKGSSDRYGLSVALAALKLPTGAITAFLGLLLMRGQFVPGLSALDTSAQILAWALVFGYAQQLFTRLVDQQGQTMLNNVPTAHSPQPSRRTA